MITVYFTPTIPNCSSASFIGLYIKLKLLRCISQKFKKTVLVKEGSHNQEEQLNKQINDKQRVCAAMENQRLREVINEALKKSDMPIEEIIF